MHAPRWNVEKSAEHYSFEDWGASYYSIGNDGDLRIFPDPARPDSNSVKLTDLVDWHQRGGGQLPAVFRFPGILKHRIHRIEEAFASMVAKHNYEGAHQLCFPDQNEPEISGYQFRSKMRNRTRGWNQK